MKRICVYCGSRPGRLASYIDGARDLGKLLAEQNIELVYGGASVGIMGAVADAVLTNGGRVIGVLPKMLTHREIAHPKLTELFIVDSMHTRKHKMFELSDGFVALPGGLGTFEELCEILTWAQLGTHRKPCGVLNINNYFDPLLQMFDKAVAEEFMAEDHRKMVIDATSPTDLLSKFKNYVPPPVPFWMRESET